MSAIKEHLCTIIDTIDEILSDFPNCEVVVFNNSSLLADSTNSEDIDAVMAAIKEQQLPGVAMHHSMLFPDMVAITISL
jgi:hypothetical protein